MKYNCSVSVSHFRDVFFQMLQFYTECITLCWQSLSLISEASLKKHLRKTVFFFLEGITWCVPQTRVHPGILAHSSRSCKKCLRSRRCRKPVTFLASDLFTTWQTGPECGVSAADLCVKRSWKLVNNGYEVEVPTPNLLPHGAVSDADEESVSCSWVPQMSGHCSLHIHSNYIWKRTKTTPQDYFPHCGVTLVAGGETNRTGDAFLNMQRRWRVDIHLSQHVITSHSCAFYLTSCSEFVEKAFSSVRWCGAVKQMPFGAPVFIFHQMLVPAGSCTTSL